MSIVVVLSLQPGTCHPVVEVVLFYCLKNFLWLGQFAVALAGKPVQSLQVSLRGKKYTVSGVETVQELREKIGRKSGVELEKHDVLFSGRRLKSRDVLSEIGVKDGAQLTLIPAKTSNPAAKYGNASSKSSSSAEVTMEKYMQNSGMDTEKLQEMMKGFSSGTTGGGPSVKESMEMMSSMMKSPMFQEYMSDPKQLENSRKMILENPMLKSMLSSMPGLEDILSDPVAWRQTMVAAANMYKNMDPDQLLKAMGQLGGDMTGLDGSGENAAAAAALDELDEDD